MAEDREFNGASFYQFLSEEELMAARCKNCRALYLPPHPLCTKCHGSGMEWVKLKGNGTLAAFTTIAVGPTSTIEEGYSRNNPYVVGIVQLEEGPKISGRINGLDAFKPNDIMVGTPITIDFTKKDDGIQCYLAFTVKS